MFEKRSERRKMKEKNNNKVQMVLMALGILLLLAAVSLVIFNVSSDRKAKKQTTHILNILLENNPTIEKERIGISQYDSEREMPAVEIETNRYIGILEIPQWNLSLPIMEEWSDENAKIAPCRYKGSVYQDDMIIAGHNYQSQFGRLRQLPIGAEIKFTDISGTTVRFFVSSIETVLDTQYHEVVSGEWDLTLFTCTYSGTKRNVVRCIKKNSL